MTNSQVSQCTFEPEFVVYDGKVAGRVNVSLDVDHLLVRKRSWKGQTQAYNLITQCREFIYYQADQWPTVKKSFFKSRAKEGILQLNSRESRAIFLFL